jgi:orotate phosphoribosyltransferase
MVAPGMARNRNFAANTGTVLRRGARVYDKAALITLVREKALKFGEFTLASGKKASYYLDGKQITLDSAGAKLIAEGILDLLGPRLPKAVGGMAIGADPITAAVITIAGVRGQALKGILVRKEAKGHGTQRFIEGPVSPGDDVVIVEDVITTGGSSLEAIERVEAFGLKVNRVIAIIDRLEGGEQAMAAKGYQLSSLLTIRDFGIEPPKLA